MVQHKKVADMRSGDDILGYYILNDPSIRTSSSGKPYLSASATDSSGSIDAKCWGYLGDITQDDNGKAVILRGNVTTYKGALQLSISQLRLPGPQDEIDYGELVPTAPIDRNETLQKIVMLVSTIQDKDYRSICEIMLEKHRQAFSLIPAAKTIHHGFRSGLLMHTWYMLCAADFYAGLYPETIDRSLLLAGTLLHDFAKEREYTIDSNGLVCGYTVEGTLLGHLVSGACEVAQTASELGVSEEKSMLLQHLILSHHGEPEFGAAVRPMSAEAELLHYLDLVDSRMEIIRENLSEADEGTFTNRIHALDKRIYRHSGTGKLDK